MKSILILCLSLITTGLAYTQTTPVNIGTGANTNSGDPLRTWAIKYNNNDFLLNLNGTSEDTDDDYTVTLSIPSSGYTTGISLPTGYVENQRYYITFEDDNDGPATLNINSWGVKNIVKQGGVALADNDIRDGQKMELVYDGTNLQIIGDGGSGSADAVTLTGTQTLTNKTLTSPVITTPAGIVKGDVGLGNVDNTSDANKPVSTAQQAALDLKANLAGPTFTGTVTLPSTTSIGTVSSTEIGYVDGATSSIQTQLDNNKLIIANQQTDNYTLVLSDQSKIVEVSKASAVNLTVPPNSSVAFPTGTIIWVKQTGAGALTIVQGSGVTVTGSSGSLNSAGQNVVMSLRKTGTDTWDLQNGSSGAWSSWVPTFTGFSSPPTVTARYALIGKTCHISVITTAHGTSNATSLTMTLPFAAASGTNQTSCILSVRDNGTTQTTPGRIQATAASNIADIYKTCATTNNWTSSGEKSASFNWTYEIQ